MIIRQPDRILCFNGNGNGNGASPNLEADIAIAVTEDRLTVSLQCARPVTHIVLHWKETLPAPARILGDHWERGYGDLEWRGMVPERVLPWYALLHEPDSGATQGFGVETGGNAFAFWKFDPAGVTLTLDVRCGGAGVMLGERVLNVATVRYWPPAAGETPFAAARTLCALLCPAPRLPKFPVYGGNDWYYAYGVTIQPAFGLETFSLFGSW